MKIAPSNNATVRVVAGRTRAPYSPPVGGRYYRMRTGTEVGVSSPAADKTT